MSVHASLPPPPSSLDAIVQRAGGVCATHAGRLVVTSYGSPAGELAACVSAVGLADSSQLTKLLLDGPGLGKLTSRLTGAELAPGGVVDAGAAWWCATDPGRTIVLCQPDRGAQLRAMLNRETARQPGITVADYTADWAVLAVVGRRARALLARFGVYGRSGDPRSVAPVVRHRHGAVMATWLLLSDDTAWAVLPRADAPALWHALERAGRPLALCAVGHEAVSRYALIRRAGMPR